MVPNLPNQVVHTALNAPSLASIRGLLREGSFQRLAKEEQIDLVYKAVVQSRVSGLGGEVPSRGRPESAVAATTPIPTLARQIAAQITSLLLSHVGDFEDEEWFTPRSEDSGPKSPHRSGVPASAAGCSESPAPTPGDKADATSDEDEDCPPLVSDSSFSDGKEGRGDVKPKAKIKKTCWSSSSSESSESDSCAD
jgi:hypothetical protein